MSGRLDWTILVVATALVAVVVVAAPGAALSANAVVDDKAPGAVGDYTVVLHPEGGDAVAQNGLKSVTLDFGADRDYSGSLGTLSARDVEVRIGGESGTVWAGETSVSQNGSEVTITLDQAFENIAPGDRIVVRVFGVTNTDIALRNAQTLRGFGIRASATDPQGATDGPVEARYTIDPSATPKQTPTAEANGSGMGSANAANASADAASATTPSMNETTETTDTTASAGSQTAETPTTETNATTGTNTTNRTSGTNATSGASGMNETGSANTDAATETAGTPTNGTTDPATTNDRNANSGQETETTGPGFGLVAGAIALLAAGLLATRKRD